MSQINRFHNGLLSKLIARRHEHTPCAGQPSTREMTLGLCPEQTMCNYKDNKATITKLPWHNVQQDELCSLI